MKEQNLSAYYGLRAYVVQDIGHRANQEDSFFPPFISPRHFDMTEREDAYYEGTPHTEDSLFILCDGMGGHERGEVASRMVCDSVSSYISIQESCGQSFCDNMLIQAVAESVKELDKSEKPDTQRKMGTTMTLLKVTNDGATIAHIGDSRVYHIRPANAKNKSRILFRTEDHNLATQMIKNGSMTLQQMSHFSQKHILTRSLQALMGVKPEVDIYHTRDIKPGDVFFLCSDGILEELYDEDLCAMLTNTNYSDEQRMQVLMQFCEGNKDNHTAWFVRVVSCGDDVYQPQAQPEHSKKHIGLFQRLRLLFKKDEQ